MKKTILALCIIFLFFASACKKTASSPGGSWTFKSATYPISTCVVPYQFPYALLANDPQLTTLYQLQCYFFNALPATGGTFIVVPHMPIAADEINIGMSIADGQHNSTGGNGTQTVNVSVTNGKVSVSGSGIMMSGPSDSSSLSFNIVQTQ